MLRNDAEELENVLPMLGQVLRHQHRELIETSALSLRLVEEARECPREQGGLARRNVGVPELNPCCQKQLAIELGNGRRQIEPLGIGLVG